MANWLSGYTTRKKITIDKSKIDSDLTDFPVLVKLTSSNFDFSKANSDGYDIRFTSADGTTLLKYERERHDSDNEVAEYWVKIPSISSSEDTIFYIYYRTEDTADGADPTNVWDSNFKGVWHMKDLTTSTIEDSTSNNNDGTKKAINEPVEVDGQIAKAQSFDGSNDYISTSWNQLTGNAARSIEVWFKTGSTSDSNWISWGTNNSNQLSQVGIWQGGLGYLGYANELTTPASAYADNAWHHLVVTFDGSAMKLYLDSVEKNSKSTTLNTGTSNLNIGRSITVSNYYNGTLDEVRISGVARSSAWIKASYYSGNNSLVSYGNEEGIDNAVFFGCNF